MDTTHNNGDIFHGTCSDCDNDELCIVLDGAVTCGPCADICVECEDLGSTCSECQLEAHYRRN